MDIGSIDRNLKIEATVTESDIKFIDVRHTKASIHGLHEPYAPGGFRRMPEAEAMKVSAGVANLVLQTAGGRVRFQTDSQYVAIRAEQPEKHLMSHMPFLGSSGFDCYVHQDGHETFWGSFVPPAAREDGYESILRFPDRRLREVTINFPLYDQVHTLYLGVQKDAEIRPSRPYRINKPVVFYGSSITQGGCASRPGNCYEAILSRKLDFDYLNFGFSGSALGEETMAQYLAGLDMSAFVMDYDHNAPDAAHLQKTHWPFFQIIRSHKPELPILIVTRPDHAVLPARMDRDAACRQVIRETYERAVANGDSRVYWIEGADMFRKYGGRDCTVDGTHPNDFGFHCMAASMYEVLRHIL